MGRKDRTLDPDTPCRTNRFLPAVHRSSARQDRRLVDPDFGAIARGMIPSIPQEKGALQLIAAMAGTTCSAAVFIVRSTVVVEKGWTINNLKDEKKDANNGN